MSDDLFYLNLTTRLFPLISNVFLGVATLMVQYSAETQQRMGTKGTPGSAAAGIVVKLCQGCVQRCPLCSVLGLFVSTAADVEAEEHTSTLRQQGGMELASGPMPAELCCVILKGRHLTPPHDKVATVLQCFTFS